MRGGAATPGEAHVRSRVVGLAAVIFLAGLPLAACSSSDSLSDGDKKLCREAAESDLVAVAGDKSLADNADIKKNAERVVPPPDGVARINNDALDAIVAACAAAGWKNPVPDEEASRDAAAQAEKSAATDVNDSQPPKPEGKFSLPAPTCTEQPFNGLRHLADYSRSFMGLEELGKGGHATYEAEMGGDGAFAEKLTGGVRGEVLGYEIPSCTAGVAKLSLGSNDPFVRTVPAKPATLKGCRNAEGPAVTDFAISNLAGKKLCMPTVNGALYLAIDAAGAPNSNGAPDLTVTYAQYVGTS
jgi:hypothetical protein